MVGKKQKKKLAWGGPIIAITHQEMMSPEQSTGCSLNDLIQGRKSQSWDDVVGYEDLLEVSLLSIIRTVILRHFSLSLMKNSNGNDVMKAKCDMMSALVLIRTQTKPHKNVFVFQDLFS